MLISFNIQFEDFGKEIISISSRIDKVEKTMVNMANDLHEVLGSSRKKLKNEAKQEKKQEQLQENQDEETQQTEPKRRGRKPNNKNE
jgi:hypothetical protein